MYTWWLRAFSIRKDGRDAGRFLVNEMLPDVGAVVSLDDHLIVSTDTASILRALADVIERALNERQ